MDFSLANIRDGVCTNWDHYNRETADSVFKSPNAAAYTEFTTAVGIFLARISVPIVGDKLLFGGLLTLAGGLQASIYLQQQVCGDEKTQSLADYTIDKVNDFQKSVSLRVYDGLSDTVTDLYNDIFVGVAENPS